MQWLIAAISVGLGFGLQEILANFVSGLIILFERPVRVGDVVTVGDVTGVISRIRMRATTITNWDRKEFIVPNKEFVTGRLLNWTLSDQVNRIVINVLPSSTTCTCGLTRNSKKPASRSPSPSKTSTSAAGGTALSARVRSPRVHGSVVPRTASVFASRRSIRFLAVVNPSRSY